MESKIEEINIIVDEALEDALANLNVDGIITSEEEKQEIKKMLIKDLKERQNIQKEKTIKWQIW